MTFLRTLFSAQAKKALVALATSVVGLVTLFTQVDVNTLPAILAVIAGVFNVGGVFVLTNE